MILKFFKKIEYFVIFISFLFTVLVSSLIGFAGVLLVSNFWGFFIIGFISQLVIFAIVNTILQRKDAIEASKIISEQLEATSKYFINLSCAYCQMVNTTPIILNQENRFKCESCGQINSVKMQFFTAQITTPLEKITFPGGIEDIN